MEPEDLYSSLKNKFPQTSTFLSGFILVLTDIFDLFLCFGAGFFIINLISMPSINFKSFINYIVFVPVQLLLFASVGLYPGIMIPPTEEVKKFTSCSFFGYSATLIIIYFMDYKNIFLKNFLIKNSSFVAVFFAILLAFIFGIVILPAGREIVKRICSHHSWWGVPAVIYTKGESAKYVVDKLVSNPYLGYHPAVILDSTRTEQTEYKGIPVFPLDDKIIDVIHKFNIKTAVLCDYKDDVSLLMIQYRYIISVSKNQKFLTTTQQLKDIAGILAYGNTHNLSFTFNRVLKRSLDIFFVLLFSPILIPIILILSILTKVTSKGPIFYGHVRIGKNGKPFKCWKFRSMCVNSQEILKDILQNDPARRAEWERDHKFIDDPRVTKFGKFLRKTSLDELPQIFNILSGQMSFVGPRPVTEEELIKYGKYRDYVLSVTPGLTGMWQVSGRSDTGYEERITFDTYYIQNWSIWLDIWILIKTVYVVIRHKGAY